MLETSVAARGARVSVAAASPAHCAPLALLMILSFCQHDADLTLVVPLVLAVQYFAFSASSGDLLMLCRWLAMALKLTQAVW